MHENPEVSNKITKSAQFYVDRLLESRDYASGIDWTAYRHLLSLAETEEIDRDAEKEEIAAQSFPGWTQEDFAMLVESIRKDSRVSALIAEYDAERSKNIETLNHADKIRSAFRRAHLTDKQVENRIALLLREHGLDQTSINNARTAIVLANNGGQIMDIKDLV